MAARTWLIVQAAFTVLFVSDLRYFRMGVSSFALATLAWPVYTLLVLGPAGGIAPIYNVRTHLIDKHFDLLVMGNVYFHLGISVLLHLCDARVAVVDLPLFRSLQASMAAPGRSIAAATLAVGLSRWVRQPGPG